MPMKTLVISIDCDDQELVSEATLEWVSALSGEYVKQLQAMNARPCYLRADGARLYWDDGQKWCRGWWIHDKNSAVYAFHGGKDKDVPRGNGWRCPGKLWMYVSIDLDVRIRPTKSRRTDPSCMQGMFSFFGQVRNFCTGRTLQFDLGVVLVPSSRPSFVDTASYGLERASQASQHALVVGQAFVDDPEVQAWAKSSAAAGKALCAIAVVAIADIVNDAIAPKPSADEPVALQVSPCREDAEERPRQPPMEAVATSPMQMCKPEREPCAAEHFSICEDEAEAKLEPCAAEHFSLDESESGPVQPAVTVNDDWVILPEADAC